MTRPQSDRRRVAIWLLRHGHNFTWLAREVGYSQSHLSNALSGRYALTKPVRDAIYRVTGIRLRPAEGVYRIAERHAGPSQPEHQAPDLNRPSDHHITER